MLEELLPYYERELSFLRQLSREFAERYPKVAARLTLDDDVSADPHVERLIEAFAFLTSRIHRKLDDELPEITEAMLGLIYPHYLAPIPSMSIVQIAIDAVDTPMTDCYRVPVGTTLLSRAVSGYPCRFKTSYPVELWPVRITEATVEAVERSPFAVHAQSAVAFIRLRLTCLGQNTFGTLPIDRLRFYLDGESPIVHALHELIFNNSQAVILAGRSAAGPALQLRLPRSTIGPVGFEPHEGVLDYDPRSFLGYRLMHEYFVLPEKFLFFDLLGLQGAGLGRFDKEVDILLPLSEFERSERLARLMQTVGPGTFRMGCTPVVNLFRQMAEPIRLDRRTNEYRVIPDLRRPKAIEVYRVERVRRITTDPAIEPVTDVLPFYSLRHSWGDGNASGFWLTTRSVSVAENDEGTDVHIAFVDRDFNPQVPEAETLSIEVTCTNRNLPNLLPFGSNESDFELESSAMVTTIKCLKKPTPTLRPPLRKGIMWRLISHLSLNHLSIVSGGTEALREILTLYNYSQSLATQRLIQGITSVESRPTVSRIGSGSRATFARGIEIALEFDENQYTGSGAYLPALVLDQFFAMYSHMNSFTKLVARTKQRERPLVTCPPRIGTGILA